MYAQPYIDLGESACNTENANHCRKGCDRHYSQCLQQRASERVAKLIEVDLSTSIISRIQHASCHAMPDESSFACISQSVSFITNQLLRAHTGTAINAELEE